MIVRRWRATAGDERKYLRHFRRRVLPGLMRIAGFNGVLILRRRRKATIGLEVLTFWTSMASIRRFAGGDADKAVVEPEAKAVLRRFDRRVRHYNVALDMRRR